MQDRELIEELQQGNLEALGEIYNRHHKMVYRTALAIVGDKEAASDLSQDVFLRLYRFANHIDLQRPLEPWLYRITANLSYTWVKRNHLGPRLVGALTEWFQASSKRACPHELTEQKEQMNQVRKAISALPLPQRMVVVMYYLNDLSLKEIAEALDIPPGTVKSRLHYGRQALKSSLGLEREENRLAEIQIQESLSGTR
jgi:RNA polymerase sigma-70 factor (ECF subfamily)